MFSKIKKVFKKNSSPSDEKKILIATASQGAVR